MAKPDYRHDLASFVEQFGFDVVPCSRCEDLDRACRMSNERTDKCASCVRLARPCDGDRNDVLSMSYVLREKNRLDALEKETRVELNKLVFRLDDLRQKQERLPGVAWKLVQQNLKTIDELEAVEEIERLAAEQAIDAALSIPMDPSMGNFNWLPSESSFDVSSFGELDLAPFGGTLQELEMSSSDAP